MADDVSLPAGKADAILCARMFPAGRSNEDVHVLRNKVFGPVLGSARVWSSELPHGPTEGVSYVRRNLDQTPFLFPKSPVMHSRHPEQRHDWFVADASNGFVPTRPAGDEDFDGVNVLVGYLKDDSEA